MNDDLVSLLAYNRWADRRVLDGCRKLSAEQYGAEPIPGWTSVRASVVHITSATTNWIRRVAGEAVAGPLTEADLPTVDDARRRLDEAYQQLDGLWAMLTPQVLATSRTFELRGRVWVLPLWVVLRHIVNHATYHRGQVASKLKRFGIDQPMTDIVFWALEQMPPEA
jgi:uncharacterized damage-inducible protein DinB